MRYGFPYKGSKNKLAEKINTLFPKKKHFYDLFCGGCAITHRALIENKFETYTINDINPLCTKLFIDAMDGKFKGESKWVSREDFFKLRGKDPYVTFCWSFGNNGRSYLYSKENELCKKAYHEAIFFNNFEPFKNLMNIDLSPIESVENIHEKYLKSKKILLSEKQAGRLELQSLESLERLNQLQSLERLESLQILNKSYDEIEIKKDSVVYCDIPYKNTEGYNKKSFDYDKFYDWCKKQTELTFISSYEMPDDFICVAEFAHRSIISAKINTAVVEKVFIPKHQLELWNELNKGESLC